MMLRFSLIGRHPIDHGVILPTTFSEHTTINGKPIRSQVEGLWETGVKQVSSSFYFLFFVFT